MSQSTSTITPKSVARRLRKAAEVLALATIAEQRQVVFTTETPRKK